MKNPYHTCPYLKKDALHEILKEIDFSEDIKGISRLEKSEIVFMYKKTYSRMRNMKNRHDVICAEYANLIESLLNEKK